MGEGEGTCVCGGGQRYDERSSTNQAAAGSGCVGAAVHEPWIDNLAPMGRLCARSMRHITRVGMQMGGRGGTGRDWRMVS